MNESYMIIAVCVLININIFSMESTGLQVMSILCAVVLSLCILLPVIFINILRQNFADLKLPKMQGKYGALYEELNLKAGKVALLVPTFFLLRRMMLAIAIVTVGKVLIWQIFLMSAQIIGQVILTGANVFPSRSKRRLEYFNEIILMTTMYTIFVYSPWTADVHLKFYVGYITIFIVSTHLGVNLGMIFGASLCQMKHNCIIKLAKRKYKRQRSALQEKL